MIQIPALVGVFGIGIKMLMAYAVTRALVALGLGYAVYSGLDNVLEEIETFMQSSYSQLGPVIDIFTMMGADTALSILFSAIAVRMLMKGMVAGSIVAMRFAQIVD